MAGLTPAEKKKLKELLLKQQQWEKEKKTLKRASLKNGRSKKTG
jgi:hypothetical protein